MPEAVFQRERLSVFKAMQAKTLLSLEDTITRVTRSQCGPSNYSILQLFEVKENGFHSVIDVKRHKTSVDLN